MEEENIQEQQEEVVEDTPETQDQQEEETPAEDKQEEETPAEDKQKDRTTQQFEKLKGSNQELKQERDKLKNVLESLYPDGNITAQNAQIPVPQAKDHQNLSQQDIDSVAKEMMDSEGFLDGRKLLSRIGDLENRAAQAEELARRAAIAAEKEQQAREQAQKTQKMDAVHSKYPALDPESDQFDTTFYELVRNDLIGQIFEGKEDPMGAADKWYQELYSKKEEQMAESKTTKQEKEVQEKKVEQKEQINASRSSATRANYASQEEDELLKKVRQGKKGALAEMLRRRGQ